MEIQLGTAWGKDDFLTSHPASFNHIFGYYLNFIHSASKPIARITFLNLRLASKMNAF